MYDAASKLYDESNAEIKKMDPKCETTNLMLNTYGYKGWLPEKELDYSTLKGYEKEELDDGVSMPKLEDEEVKEGTGIKILTPNKPLARLPVLLAQMKTGNN